MPQLHLHTNIIDFLQQTQQLLEEDEVSNGLMLGISLRMKEHPERTPEGLFLATVHDDNDDNQLTAAAVMTPPHNLIVLSNCVDPTLPFEQIAHALQQWSHQPPGVNGRKESSQAFAKVWRRLTSQSFHAAVQMRVFKLTEVHFGLDIPGRMRVATMQDLIRVTQWQDEFEHEALGHAAGRTDPGAVEWAICEGNRFLWEIDGEPVSMAGKTRPTAHGCTVGPVYTPPKLRGKGYATALVAHLSQHLLDSGYDFATLFTDLANPTSNSIYQRIGYQPICDFTEFAFSQSD